MQKAQGGSSFGQGAPKTLGPNAPSQQYLLTKRTSVFSKPYESVQEILDHFVPPKYEKPQKAIERIITVLQESFLTKHLS